jgi:hypothetical protein
LSTETRVRLEQSSFIKKKSWRTSTLSKQQVWHKEEVATAALCERDKTKREKN